MPITDNAKDTECVDWLLQKAFNRVVDLDLSAAITEINTTNTLITVADESADTTCFPAFFTAATGDLQPKTNTGLTYNSNTNELGASIFYFKADSLRDVTLRARNTTDNQAIIYQYPVSSTNAATTFNLIPKGTGTAALVQSILSLFSSDWVADSTNHSQLQLRADTSVGTDGGYSLASEKAGTGTLYPIWIDATGTHMQATANIFCDTTGRVGINGVTTPTANLHLAAGTASASTAPLKFNSGALLSVAEAGAVEFLTDAYYATITTGAARKTFAFLESPTFTGTVTIPTPFTLGAVSVTSTGTQLNYLNAATGTTGTTSTNLVFSTSPTFITPILGVASAVSLTVGSILSNGDIILNIDADNNSTTNFLQIRKDLTTEIWKIIEVGNISHTTTTTGGISHTLTADSLNSGTGLKVNADGLTTGKIAQFISNSANVSTRNLVEIHNDNAAATGAIPLKLMQDALISTNFKKFTDLSGVTIWTGGGTDPNTVLSGTAGDVCFNCNGNVIKICTGGTAWS